MGRVGMLGSTVNNVVSLWAYRRKGVDCASPESEASAVGTSMIAESSIELSGNWEESGSVVEASESVLGKELSGVELLEQAARDRGIKQARIGIANLTMGGLCQRLAGKANARSQDESKFMREVRT
jgi:hypothetical protein